MNCELTPELLQVVNRVANQLRIDNFELNLEPGNSKGAGYLGEIFYINIQDRRNNKVTEIVIKKAFSTDSARTILPISVCFINEINFYSSVWLTLEMFQEEFKLKNKFDKIPKCILTSSSERFEMLVLENLKSGGFKVHPKEKFVDAAHINQIFQQYGKFHALSFAYRHHHPEKYNILVDNITDVFQEFLKTKTFINILNGLCKKATKCFDPAADAELVKVFQKYVDNPVKQFIESMTYQGKYSAILHGDGRSNNMMFKYDNFRNVVDMRFIDFQLCRVGTPVLDLSYSFYSGASKESFDRLDEFLQVYHDSFSSFLREFGCHAYVEFPLGALKKDWKKYAKYGMLFALLVIKDKVTKQEDLVDIQDMANSSDNGDMLFNADCDEEQLYRMYRELFLHLHERDCL